MIPMLRPVLLGLLVALSAASADELVFDVETVDPPDAGAAFSLRVAVVHRGRWTTRERLEQKRWDAEREFQRYDNLVRTVHPLFPEPIHGEWAETRDQWMLARIRYSALIESYGPLQWVFASSPVLYAPQSAVLRVSESRLRAEAQVSEPGDVADVRLEVFRRRWFRRPKLLATVETQVRLQRGHGAVFHFGQPGFAVKIRSRWRASACATEMAW